MALTESRLFLPATDQTLLTSTPSTQGPSIVRATKVGPSEYLPAVRVLSGAGRKHDGWADTPDDAVRRLLRREEEARVDVPETELAVAGDGQGRLRDHRRDPARDQVPL